MKEVSCRDLSGKCDYVARGETNDELKKDVFRHAEERHPELLEDMTDRDRKDMERKIEAAAR